MGERSGEGLRRGAGESFGDPAGKSVTCSGFRATSPASGFHSPEQDRKHPETQAGLTRPAEIPFSSAYGCVQGTGHLRVYGLWRSSTSPAQLSLRVRPPATSHVTQSLPHKLILQPRQGVGSDEYQPRASQPPPGTSHGEIASASPVHWLTRAGQRHRDPNASIFHSDYITL